MNYLELLFCAGIFTLCSICAGMGLNRFCSGVNKNFEFERSVRTFIQENEIIRSEIQNLKVKWNFFSEDYCKTELLPALEERLKERNVETCEINYKIEKSLYGEKVVVQIKRLFLGDKKW